MNNGDLHGEALAVTELISKITRKFLWVEADEQATALPLAQLRLCSILHDGPKTMSALSKDLHISLSAVTQVADRLEKSGLVERVCETEDRRVKCLQLTKDGRSMMSERKMKRIGRIYDVLNYLTLEEREKAISGLKVLLDAYVALSDSSSRNKSTQDLAYVQELFERI